MSEISHMELTTTARRIAALVPTSEASRTFTGLVDALESLTAALTETEADLQASRGREEAASGVISNVKALLDAPTSNGVTWWVWIEDGLGGTLHDDLRAILETAPSSALDAVKAAAWAEGFEAGEADVFQHEEKGWTGGHGDNCIPNPYRPIETEGESLG